MQILLLPLLCLIASAFASYQPGVELQVHQRGINEGVRLGKQWVEENMKKLSIPDNTGTILNFHYAFTSHKVAHFGLGSAGLQLHQPNAMTFKASDVWINITARYEVWFETLVFKKKFGWKSGALSMKLKISNINAIFALSTSETGHPKLQNSLVLVQFSSLPGDVQIIFTGGILDKIFTSVINKLIAKLPFFVKPIVDLGVSIAARHVLLKYANPLLEKIPVDVEFPAPAQGFHIDYHLTSSPFVRDSSIVLPFRGKLWYRNHQDDSQIPKANGVIHPVNTNEMICFVLDGDEVFGSAAYALQVSPLNKIDLDLIKESKEREKIKNFLRCSCEVGKCIGSLIPAIERNCLSSGMVTLDLKSASAPAFHFNTSGAFVDASFAIRILTASADGAVVKDLLSMTADVGFLFKNNLRLDGWTIKQNITMTDAKLSLGSSKPGSEDICPRIFDMIWEGAVQQLLDRGLKDVTTKGIPLPPIPNAKLIYPRFIFDKYTFALCSDVQATL